MEKIAKVLSNVAQSLTSDEKAQARANIDAVSSTELTDGLATKQDALTAGPNIDIYNNVISTEKPRVYAGTNVSVSSSIDNVNRTITYTVSATDTTYSAGSGLSLTGTTFSNSAPNVKSDWDAASGSDAEIINKPTIPTKTSQLQNDSGFVTSSQVPSAQVNSDWNSTSGVSEILNKPNVTSVNTKTSSAHGDVTSPVGTMNIWGDGRVYLDGVLSGNLKDMFMAYYSGYATGHDNTPFSDIEAAANAGKCVVLYTSSGGSTIFYTLDSVTSSRAMFRRSMNTFGSVITVQASDDSYAINTVSLQPALSAGTGIEISSNTVSWEYSVGRNLWLNQNNQIQTNLPGGQLKPTLNTWTAVGKFAGAYRLVARANPSGTYDIGMQYFGSGGSSHFTLIGTQTVVPASSSSPLSVTKCNYVHSYVEQTNCTQIGDHFDPSVSQSMTVEGTMFCGSMHDFRAVIYKDENNDVQVAFTAIETGKVGATN